MLDEISILWIFIEQNDIGNYILISGCLMDWSDDNAPSCECSSLHQLLLKIPVSTNQISCSIRGSSGGAEKKLKASR